MAASKGQTTARILALLREQKPERLSAEEIADALELDARSISAILLKLTRYGQVERIREDRGTVTLGVGVSRAHRVYAYTVTPKGEGRLERLVARRIFG